jgi:hypothetical protein
MSEVISPQNLEHTGTGISLTVYALIILAL